MIRLVVFWLQAITLVNCHFPSFTEYFDIDFLAVKAYYGPFADYVQCKFYRDGLYYNLNATKNDKSISNTAKKVDMSETDMETYSKFNGAMFENFYN
jgi:hypothetical protein